MIYYKTSTFFSKFKIILFIGIFFLFSILSYNFVLAKNFTYLQPSFPVISVAPIINIVGESATIGWRNVNVNWIDWRIIHKHPNGSLSYPITHDYSQPTGVYDEDLSTEGTHTFFFEGTYQDFCRCVDDPETGEQICDCTEKSVTTETSSPKVITAAGLKLSVKRAGINKDITFFDTEYESYVDVDVRAESAIKYDYCDLTSTPINEWDGRLVQRKDQNNMYFIQINSIRINNTTEFSLTCHLDDKIIIRKISIRRITCDDKAICMKASLYEINDGETSLISWDIHSPPGYPNTSFNSCRLFSVDESNNLRELRSSTTSTPANYLPVNGPGSISVSPSNTMAYFLECTKIGDTITLENCGEGDDMEDIGLIQDHNGNIFLVGMVGGQMYTAPKSSSEYNEWATMVGNTSGPGGGGPYGSSFGYTTGYPGKMIGSFDAQGKINGCEITLPDINALAGIKIKVTDVIPDINCSINLARVPSDLELPTNSLINWTANAIVNNATPPYAYTWTGDIKDSGLVIEQNLDPGNNPSGNNPYTFSYTPLIADVYETMVNLSVKDKNNKIAVCNKSDSFTTINVLLPTVSCEANLNPQGANLPVTWTATSLNFGCDPAYTWTNAVTGLSNPITYGPGYSSNQTAHVVATCGGKTASADCPVDIILPTKYLCNNSTYMCYEDPNGESLENCQDHCIIPTKYSCNHSTNQCYIDPSGDTLENCQAVCKDACTFIINATPHEITGCINNNIEIWISNPHGIGGDCTGVGPNQSGPGTFIVKCPGDADHTTCTNSIDVLISPSIDLNPVCSITDNGKNEIGKKIFTIYGAEINDGNIDVNQTHYLGYSGLFDTGLISNGRKRIDSVPKCGSSVLEPLGTWSCNKCGDVPDSSYVIESDVGKDIDPLGSQYNNTNCGVSCPAPTSCNTFEPNFIFSPSNEIFLGKEIKVSWNITSSEPRFFSDCTCVAECNNYIFDPITEIWTRDTTGQGCGYDSTKVGIDRYLWAEKKFGTSINSDFGWTGSLPLQSNQIDTYKDLNYRNTYSVRCYNNQELDLGGTRVVEDCLNPNFNVTSTRDLIVLPIPWYQEREPSTSLNIFNKLGAYLLNLIGW